MLGRRSTRDIALETAAELRIRADLHEQRHDQLDQVLLKHIADNESQHVEQSATMRAFHAENEKSTSELRTDMNGLGERLHTRITGILWWIIGSAASIIAGLVWLAFHKVP